MVFEPVNHESVNHKVQPVKAKSFNSFNPPAKPAKTGKVFEVNGAHEHVPQERVFTGDTAKHVL